MKLIDLTGQKFGKWLVLNRVHGSRVLWACKCDCGCLGEVDASNLRDGRSAQCKVCRARKRPFEYIFNAVRSQAKNRGISFGLSYEDLLGYTNTKVCHYCNDPVAWSPHSLRDGNRKTIGSRGYHLDRKDNALGYSKDNCVVCCQRCNMGKGKRYTYEEWWVMTRVFREKSNGVT